MSSSSFHTHGRPTQRPPSETSHGPEKTTKGGIEAKRFGGSIDFEPSLPTVIVHVNSPTVGYSLSVTAESCTWLPTLAVPTTLPKAVMFIAMLAIESDPPLTTKLTPIVWAPVPLTDSDAVAGTTTSPLAS